VAGMMSGMLARGSLAFLLAPDVRQRQPRQLTISFQPIAMSEMRGNSTPRPIARNNFRFSTILSLYQSINQSFLYCIHAQCVQHFSNERKMKPVTSGGSALGPGGGDTGPQIVARPSNLAVLLTQCGQLIL